MDAIKMINEHADTLQSIATLVWINTGDAAMMERITALKLGYSLWTQLSGEQDVDALRNQAIASIAKYVQENPKAKKEELQKEISRQIFDFARKDMQRVYTFYRKEINRLPHYKIVHLSNLKAFADKLDTADMDGKILDYTKLKASANRKLHVVGVMGVLFKRLENIEQLTES